MLHTKTSTEETRREKPAIATDQLSINYFLANIKVRTKCDD